MGVLAGAALLQWKSWHGTAAWSLKPGWRANGLLLCKVRRLERCEMHAVVLALPSVYQRASRKRALEVNVCYEGELVFGKSCSCWCETQL